MSSSSSKDKVAVEEVNETMQEEPDGEVRKPQIARRPYTPTRAEVEAHLPLHLEYRSWCKHCRAGKDISMHHAQSKDGHVSELGATISLDYCFMTPEEEEDDMRAILIGYDHQRSGFWALPV